MASNRVHDRPATDASSCSDRLLGLVAQEEAEGPPFGRALDIGTGSGVWGVALAERGWEVTGLDIVEKALARATERAARAGVRVSRTGPSPTW